MKRKIALFMVLAMLISLVPMNVFAASSNSVLAAPTVTKDTVLGVSGQTTPTLRFEEGGTAQWQAGTQTFELVLTNGEFQSAMDKNNIALKLAGVTTATLDGRVTLTKNTDTYATVAVYIKAGGASAGTDKYSFDLPLAIKATGGEVSVKVDPRDSRVSPGTYVVANGVSGATNTTVASVKSFADSIILDTLRIDETTIASVTATTQSKLRLLLPAGFEWTTSTIKVRGAGGFNVNAPTTALTVTATDAREATFLVTPSSAAATERGTLYVTGLSVRRTSDAKVGDVTLNIKEVSNSPTKRASIEFTDQSLVVAKYVTYDVTVEATGDPLTIYAGRYEGTGASTGDDNEHKVVKLRIKEQVMNSWLASRITKIQFNDEAKIMGFKIKKADYITGGSIKTDTDAALSLAAGLDTYRTTTLTNRNYVEISNATITTGQKADVELEFYVSVKANYTGDITATVSGTALTKETKVVLGKAVAPAAVSVVAKDLRLGLQNQLIGDIVITEPAKGVWGANANGTSENIVFSFDAGTINEKGTVSVTKGDVTLGNYTTGGTIPVKYASTVASEITIKGVSIDLLRNIPEGKFDIAIGGTSLVDNNATAETYTKFNKSSAVTALAFNVITPADGNTKTIQKVVFTIDSMEYMVGDAKVTSDVAPYVNENGRTMLPLRAFANALNVTNDNIVWNETERSVIIFKGESTVKVVIGQMSFEKNGVNVPMDTMAMIKDGRTMLPLRAVAQALGAQIAWDDATRTVTVQ